MSKLSIFQVMLFHFVGIGCKKATNKSLLYFQDIFTASSCLETELEK